MGKRKLLSEMADPPGGADRGRDYNHSSFCDLVLSGLAGIRAREDNILEINPIFTADKENTYEQDRVGGCQVIKTPDMGYVMFYIGYENIDKVQICIARSEDGITQWKKSPANPIVFPEAGAWDADACYKPSFLWNEEENKWMLWYNGRSNTDEFIGYVYKEGRSLF